MTKFLESKTASTIVSILIIVGMIIGFGFIFGWWGKKKNGNGATGNVQRGQYSRLTRNEIINGLNSQYNYSISYLQNLSISELRNICCRLRWEKCCWGKD